MAKNPNDTIHVKCPHPDCEARMRVGAKTPDGVYPCICKACRIQLTWNHYLDRGRVPSVRLAKEST